MTVGHLHFSVMWECETDVRLLSGLECQASELPASQPLVGKFGVRARSRYSQTHTPPLPSAHWPGHPRRNWLSFTQKRPIRRQSLFFFFFFLLFFFISWRLITLQYCSGFCHTLTWISHGHTCIPHPDPPLPPPSPPDPSGSSQCTRSKHLSHLSNLGWWSDSHS